MRIIMSWKLRYVWVKAKTQLTIKTVHVQHHVGPLPIGCPLQEWEWICPCGLRGGAWAELCLLIGLDESVLQQRLTTMRGVIRHKPWEQRIAEDEFTLFCTFNFTASQLWLVSDHKFVEISGFSHIRSVHRGNPLRINDCFSYVIKYTFQSLLPSWQYVCVLCVEVAFLLQ